VPRDLAQRKVDEPRRGEKGRKQFSTSLPQKRGYSTLELKKRKRDLHLAKSRFLAAKSEGKLPMPWGGGEESARP